MSFTIAESARTQAAIDKNETIKNAFQEQIKNIDDAIANKGKRYLNRS